MTRIVIGSGNRREVLDLPAASVRLQDPKQLEALTRNLQERICGAEYALQRKGFNIYR